MDILLGSDVELAVIDPTGVPVDVSGMLGGTKSEPRWFDNYNVQEDSVNAEYAINPVPDLDSWLSYHNQALAGLDELLPDGYRTACHASNTYAEESVTDRSKVRGCDKDYSAWTGLPNQVPDLDRVGNLFTCGGHIHVGVANINKVELVKWLDIYLGLPSLFSDKDRHRRKVYGKAGSYRPKPYGVEYRALSNFWVSSEELMTWAYEQTMKAIDSCMSLDIDDIPVLYTIPRAIDTYDMFAADSAYNWLSKEGIL